jgi:hypothetical protein
LFDDWTGPRRLVYLVVFAFFGLVGWLVGWLVVVIIIPE